MSVMLIEEIETESLVELFSCFYQPDDDTPHEYPHLLPRVNALLQTALEYLYYVDTNSEWYEFPFLFHYAMKVIRVVLDKLDGYPIDAIQIIDFQGSVLIEY